MLDFRVESETYPIRAAGLQADFARNGDVPFIGIVATHDEKNGQECILMLNRDLDMQREGAMEWEGVAPQPLAPPAAGSRMSFRLPPRSYSVAHLSVNA